MLLLEDMSALYMIYSQLLSLLSLLYLPHVLLMQTPLTHGQTLTPAIAPNIRRSREKTIQTIKVPRMCRRAKAAGTRPHHRPPPPRRRFRWV
jgi:hypothetical protein